VEDEASLQEWEEWKRATRALKKKEGSLPDPVCIPGEILDEASLHEWEEWKCATRALKKKEGSLPEGFGPIIEMLVKDFEATERNAEGTQEAEKAKTRP
jgi:hypothetical protein